MRNKIVDKVSLIPIEKIYPNPAQPRKIFDKNEMLSLADSISKNGLLQPILLRKMPDGRYLIISGERRFRAVKMLGRDSISAIVRTATDEQSAVFALIENIQRKNLSFFEEAKAISELISVWGISQDEAAQKLGKAQSTIANKIRLLKIPEQLRSEIEKNGLTERHARALLQIEDEELQKGALQYIIAKNLNVAQTERYISELTAPKKTPTVHKKYMVKDLRLFLNTVNRAVETMLSSGLDAYAKSSENEEFFEYVVRIPKNKAYKKMKECRVKV